MFNRRRPQERLNEGKSAMPPPLSHFRGIRIESLATIMSPPSYAISCIKLGRGNRIAIASAVAVGSGRAAKSAGNFVRFVLSNLALSPPCFPDRLDHSHSALPKRLQCRSLLPSLPTLRFVTGKRNGRRISMIAAAAALIKVSSCGASFENQVEFVSAKPYRGRSRQSPLPDLVRLFAV